MKLSGIASVLGLALVLCAPNIGCEDENNPPKRDAGGKDTRASDGSTSADGSADRSGSDAGPDLAPDVAAGDAPDAGVVDAPVTLDVNSDRPVDTAPMPDTVPMFDTAPPTPDTSPDTGPASDGGPIVAENCDDDVVCPALFNLANMCNGDNQMCTVNTTATDPNEVRAICFMNGVKKIATDTSPMDDVTLTTLVVTKADTTPCYNLEVTNAGDDPELWVFKAPGAGGVELGRATVDSTTDTTLFTCAATGVVYNISNAGCAGMEGEGGCNPGTTCTN